MVKRVRRDFSRVQKFWCHQHGNNNFFLMKMCTIAQVKHSEEKLKDLSQVSGSPTAEMREKTENSKGGWEVARDVKGKSVVVQPLIYSSHSSTQLKRSSPRGGRLFFFVHCFSSGTYSRSSCTEIISVLCCRISESLLISSSVQINLFVNTFIY